jgi:hypothetical protein
MLQGPTQAGFLVFVRDVMGVPVPALPDNSPALVYAFNVAFMTVNPLLGVGVSVPPAANTWSIYALAVYNLGGDRLINYAPDTPPSTYFKTLRGPAPEGYGINNFVAGVVSAAADEATSNTLLVPDAFKGLTIADLQKLKTPFGIEYLSLAQQWGPSVWGLT